MVQPELTQIGRLIGALTLGAFAGLIIGVLAMAVCTLVLNLIELIAGKPVAGFAGLPITAVSFVLCGTLGWIISAVVAWNKLKPPTSLKG